MRMLWAHIKGFKPAEKWGDPDKMNGLAVMLLEKVREAFRNHYDSEATFHLHAGYDTGGHSFGSEHYQGNALDFHIQTSLSYPEQVNAMLEILTCLQVASRVGMGIYPDWNSPGFHLDVRGEFARWGGVMKHGKQEYTSFDAAKKHAEEKEKN